MVCKHKSILCCCHKTGIKAYKIEFDLCCCKCIINLSKTHGAAGCKLLIITISAYRTAAVIPEDKGITVSSKILLTILDEICQSIRICHGFTAKVLLKTYDTVIFYLPDLIGLAADCIVLPCTAASGVDNEIYFIGKIRIDHLLKVRCCHLAS